MPRALQGRLRCRERFKADYAPRTTDAKERYMILLCYDGSPDARSAIEHAGE